MSGLVYFFIAMGIAGLNGLLLWRTVTSFQPEKTKHALLLTRSGALGRCLSAAIFLAVTMHQSFHTGLCALAGFVLGHLLWVGIIGSRMANPTMAGLK